MSRRATAALRPCIRGQEWQLPPIPNSPFPFAGSPMAHVHFPPTPSLTSEHYTHSAKAYDRAPITVSINECALPERGGRTYVQEEDKPRKRRTHTPAAPRAQPPSASIPAPMMMMMAAAPGSYFPANAITPSMPIPMLVSDRDHSSESDESDLVMTPPEASYMPAHAYSFLPHAPEPHQYHESGRGRETRRKSSSSSSTKRRAHVAQGPVPRSAFAQELELDGCLGGF